jgi:hypothetical protein
MRWEIRVAGTPCKGAGEILNPYGGSPEAIERGVEIAS